MLRRLLVEQVLECLQGLWPGSWQLLDAGCDAADGSDTPYPARTTVGSFLGDFLVEIDVVAVVP